MNPTVKITELYNSTVHFKVERIKEFIEIQGAYNFRKKKGYVRLISSKIFSRVPQNINSLLFSIVSHIDSILSSSPAETLEINSLNTLLRKAFISEKNSHSALPSGISLNMYMHIRLDGAATTHSSSGSSSINLSKRVTNSPNLSASIRDEMQKEDKIVFTGREGSN